MSADGLEALSVSELRALLTGARVQFADCVEKARRRAEPLRRPPRACDASRARLLRRARGGSVRC
jgi:hypothetical protein